MADKKQASAVSETPIAEITANRHPSDSEKSWAENTLLPALENNPEKPIGAPSGINVDDQGRARFTTISGVPIRRLYTPADLPEDWNYEQHLGYPGQPPFTRGIHATGYRGKMYTMRQFSGFASPEETNQRYKYLLEHGGSGLSVAFDLPTLMGYDSDHPASEGEVGKCGVAIDSLEDMEILFDGIDLEKTTVSMTINSPASVLWAMYLVVAEKQGADWKKISGTIQNDILKEYIAQKEYIYPPAPSMRLVVDTFEFGSKFTPRFNTISISGYHIREAGSTAVQELAFTLYDGVEYVEWALRRGLDVDEFGPRLSFFFNAHNVLPADLGDAKSLCVIDFLQDDLGAFFLLLEAFYSAANIGLDDVIAEDHANRIVAGKVLGQAKCFRDATLAFLIRVVEVLEAKITPVAEEPEKVTGIFPPGDE